MVLDLDFDGRYRAVKSRDPRFDGRFFTGVTSTGIYCRPSCPATTPKVEHVRFYPTAAAAQEAGFRACKRCIPGVVPGSPAWDLRADVAGRPAVKGLLAVLSKHLQTDGDLGAGLHQGLDDPELRAMVRFVRVLLAHDDDAAFSQGRSQLGERRSAALPEVVDELVGYAGHQRTDGGNQDQQCPHFAFRFHFHR